MFVGNEEVYTANKWKRLEIFSSRGLEFEFQHALKMICTTLYLQLEKKNHKMACANVEKQSWQCSLEYPEGYNY